MSRNHTADSESSRTLILPASTIVSIMPHLADSAATSRKSISKIIFQYPLCFQRVVGKIALLKPVRNVCTAISIECSAILVTQTKVVVLVLVVLTIVALIDI